MSRIYIITYLLLRHQWEATTIWTPAAWSSSACTWDCLSLFSGHHKPETQLALFGSANGLYTGQKQRGNVRIFWRGTGVAEQKEYCSRCVFGAWSTCRLCVKEQAHVLLPLPFDAPDSKKPSQTFLWIHICCVKIRQTPNSPNQDGDTEADLPD